MKIEKIAKWTLIGLFCLFILWLGGLFVNIVFAIFGILTTLASLLLKLVFSKFGITLIAIGLVIYLINQRSKSREYHY